MLGLFPEPNNPVANKAIGFKFLIDESWLPIGYVVREALDDVHSALEQHQIIDMKFVWVKLIL